MRRSDIPDPSRYGYSEVIASALYDYQPFVGIERSSGSHTMEFFCVPIGGNGGAYPSAPRLKTREDTNLHLANALPSGVAFMVNEIEVAVIPQGERSNRQRDYELFGERGRLQFQVLDKMYLDLAPIGRFMRPWERVEVIGPAMQKVESCPWTHGPYGLGKIPFTLLPVQMFGVVLVWDHAPPIYVTPPRVGVVFHGIQQRPSC